VQKIQYATNTDKKYTNFESAHAPVRVITIEKCIEKGRLAAAKDVAMKLLTRGMAPDEAAVISGLSLEDLARLIKS